MCQRKPRAKRKARTWLKQRIRALGDRLKAGFVDAYTGCWGRRPRYWPAELQEHDCRVKIERYQRELVALG